MIFYHYASVSIGGFGGFGDGSGISPSMVMVIVLSFQLVGEGTPTLPLEEETKPSLVGTGSGV